MIEKYTLNDKDLERSGIGGLWMKRFVTAEDLSFRAGFGKKEPKTSSEGVYWYHEFLHIMSGKGQYSCEPSRWNPEKRSFTAEKGDAVYIQKGTKWRVECISDEPLVFFYVAIPASSQGLDYELFPATTEKPSPSKTS